MKHLVDWGREVYLFDEFDEHVGDEADKRSHQDQNPELGIIDHLVGDPV
jgi:hypothetical protein